MPPNINSVTGLGAERPSTGAETLIEIRRRQTERLREAQAETDKSIEVVEGADKTDEALNDPAKTENPLYRVNLNPNTGRLTTEVLDKITGDVILRIPPEYAGSVEAEKNDESRGEDI